MTNTQTAAQLVEMLCGLQRQRWQAGERVLAEAYLQEYPTLSVDADRAVELIFNEFL
jgi:hypothetical protein